MEWTKYIPRCGDLIILDYGEYDGIRVGIFIRSALEKTSRHSSKCIIVWHIKWIAQKNKNLPPEWITESIIFNYLKIGAARIYKTR